MPRPKPNHCAMCGAAICGRSTHCRQCSKSAHYGKLEDDGKTHTCPKCGSTRCRRDGSKRGKTRFKCECGKQFQDGTPFVPLMSTMRDFVHAHETMPQAPEFKTTHFKAKPGHCPHCSMKLNDPLHDDSCVTLKWFGEDGFQAVKTTTRNYQHLI